MGTLLKVQIFSVNVLNNYGLEIVALINVTCSVPEMLMLTGHKSFQSQNFYLFLFGNEIQYYIK